MRKCDAIHFTPIISLFSADPYASRAPRWLRFVFPTSVEQTEQTGAFWCIWASAEARWVRFAFARSRVLLGASGCIREHSGASGRFRQMPRWVRFVKER